MTAFVLVTLVFALGLFLLYFWIKTIVDIIKSDFKREESKYIWLIAVIVFPFVATIVYHFVGHDFKGRSDREYGFVE